MKRKALGKGLNSLIPSAPPKKVEPEPAARSSDSRLVEIDLDRIRANPEQPRKEFDKEALASLADSMKDSGVLQPIAVRRIGEDRYEIVAGERRWRAAQWAGLLRIPAWILDVPEDRRLELALIENLQREDLSPIDEALAYRALMDSAGYTQQQVADRVGKPRATVANALRLLSLPKAVQEWVRARQIPMGHARALAALTRPGDQKTLAARIVRQGLSARQVEREVARMLAEDGPQQASRRGPVRDPNVVAAEDKLQALLGTRVRIVQSKRGSGRLELHFGSDEELQRIYELVEGAIRGPRNRK
jgi:ParB family chromosome partitioning protein